MKGPKRPLGRSSGNPVPPKVQLPQRSRTRPPPAPALARQSRASPGAQTRKTSARLDRQDQLNEDLAVEAYTLLRLALHRLTGMSAAAQQRALKRSWNLKSAPRVSGPLLRDVQSLSALLLEWSQESRYLDAKGNPRVLSVEGSGETFETLAREFLPHLTLAQVVEMACATAGVSMRPGGKIALLGDLMVNVYKTNTPPLAHLIRQLDQLIETNLHNAYLPPGERDKGRMQRVVTGVITRAQYPRLMQVLRPQLANQLARADSLIEHYQPQTARELKNAIAVSLSVFVAEETDWERAGIDINAQVKKAKRS